MTRTTVDLEPELHSAALERARQSRLSLSQVVNDALRATFRPVAPVERDHLTGLGRITVGHRVTAAEVADALEEK